TLLGKRNILLYNIYVMIFHAFLSMYKIYIKCVAMCMNYKQQQNLTWFTWKRFITLLIVMLILIIAIYGFYTYKQIKASKTTGFEASTQIILEETEIAEIDEMYAFQHDVLYHIAYGKSDDNERLIAFVPKTVPKKDKEKENDEKQEKKEKNDDDDDKEMKDIINVDGSDMLSKEDIEVNWHKDCDQCTLKSSGPAMIDDTPLWELTYFDADDRFVMEYRQLEDGDI